VTSEFRLSARSAQIMVKSRARACVEMVSDLFDSRQDEPHPQVQNEWVKKAERDSGYKRGLTSDMATRLKPLEPENWNLRQANEIGLRRARTLPAEFDRRHDHRGA
jgi:hypothetical protein